MLGRVVGESQRDWDERVPMDMAAYRASRQEASDTLQIFLCLVEKYVLPLTWYWGPIEKEYAKLDDFVEEILTSQGAGLFAG